MIDKSVFWNMKWDRGTAGMTISQLSAKHGVSENTVRRWLKTEDFKERKPREVDTRLKPFESLIDRTLAGSGELSARQIHQTLVDEGYEGSYSTVRRHVAKVRPKPPRAYLKLHFDPGDAVQVDFGLCGHIPFGRARRRLSALVMTLCHSRLMYVEFILCERQEHFLTCLQNGFRFFGGVPARVIVDNCKCAVLRHNRHEPPVFNPRFLDFAGHFGFKPVACNPRSPHEKGVVENAVGYLKKNLMPGKQFNTLAEAQTTLRHWLDNVANVRSHGATGERPGELYERVEREKMGVLNPNSFDCAAVENRRADQRCRVWFDGNAYSVPSRCAGKAVVVKALPDAVRIYFDSFQAAAHVRSYDSKIDIVDPDHVEDIKKERRRAEEQNLVRDFLRLGPAAATFRAELELKELNPRHHIRVILALAETRGGELVAGALESAVEFRTFRSEYVVNIVAQKGRANGAPTGVLHVPRAGDLLDLRMEQPDLREYEI